MHKLEEICSNLMVMVLVYKPDNNDFEYGKVNNLDAVSRISFINISVPFQLLRVLRLKQIFEEGVGDLLQYPEFYKLREYELQARDQKGVTWDVSRASTDTWAQLKATLELMRAQNKVSLKISFLKM